MSKVKSRTVRRIVLEENTMSEAAFEFRVNEVLHECGIATGIMPMDFVGLILLAALDKGRIWLKNVDEDKKRTILATFGALEHLIDSKYTSDELDKAKEAFQKAYLIG